MPNLSKLALLAGLCCVSVVSGEEQQPPAKEPAQDPMIGSIEKILKPLKDFPTPKKEAEFKELERLGDDATLQIQQLGPKAADTLLDMAFVSAERVPAVVLSRVLLSQPKRAPEWVKLIGEKLFGKVYKEPDYWLYVIHSFQDPAAVKYLMPLLQYRCGPVGKIILSLTEKHGDMQIVREYLEDEKSEPRVRAELLIMLSYAERSDLALPIVIRALRDPDLEARYEAVIALGSLKLNGQPPPAELREYLKHEDTKLRRVTAKTCGMLGLLDHVPSIVPLLKDENKSLQEDARAVLAWLVGQNFGPAPENWMRWWENLGSKFPAQLNEALVKRTSAASQEEKLAVLKTLIDVVMLRDPRIEQLALGCLQDADPVVRADAVKIFLAMPIGLPSIHGLAGLVSALRDENANVRELCHHVLLKQSKLKMPPDFVLWKDWLLRREAVPDILKLTALSMWNYKPADIPMEVPMTAVQAVSSIPAMPSRAAALPAPEAPAAEEPPADASAQPEARHSWMEWAMTLPIILMAVLGLVWVLQKVLKDRTRLRATRLAK